MKPKKELIRVVRSERRRNLSRPDRKKNGRGAYLTLDKECILASKKKNTLQNQFQSQIDDQIFEELLELAEKVKK
ncbi:YlxR family protein [Bacillus inaquosorum]|nr:YlxR family protein [Bacillus inaquosorum]